MFEPARVVALERNAAPSIEFEDPAGHVVEEVPVVGDRHDGARVVLQKTLEPRDRLGVEMVGRLIEQQKIGGGQQDPAQRDPPTLTAGQCRDIGVAGRAAQRVHGDLYVALEIPCVGGVDPVLELGLECTDLVEVGIGIGPHRQHFVVAIDDGLHGTDPVHHIPHHVPGRVEVRFLREITDAESTGEPGLAGEAVVETGHDAQQR